MVMIRVQDRTLRSMLLTHLVEQIERGGFDHLVAKGIQPSTLDKLRTLTVPDLLHLVETGHPDIHFSIDEAAIDLGMARVELLKTEMNELAYYVENGASLSMLIRLFPRTDQRVIEEYRKLLAPARKPGRPSLPNDKTRDLVHQAWFASRDARALRTRLMALHQQFQSIPLETLFATVNEFGAEHG